jgi:peptidoglycan/xylan/chitin deacetylase (PgdA/CDA1 family)
MSSAANATSTSSASALAGGEPKVPPVQRPTVHAVPAGPRAQVVFKIHTTDQVVFVTIDDGFYKDPRVVAFIRVHQWPVATFIIDRVAEAAPSYFRALAAAGATINDHTYSHPDLPGLDYAAQEEQICRPTRDFPRLLGLHPRLFRPPYGSYDLATRRAAEACGFSALVEWNATLSNGRLDIVGHHQLHPGDIVLLHFVPSLYRDLVVLAMRLSALHLRVGRLENYVKT